MLDPTVELRVYVFASNPDFDPITPRLLAYVKGDDDEAIGAGLGELRRLRDEVTGRGKLLERHGAAKVTRKLAAAVKGLHPVVVVFDECHEMFEHPEFGAEAGSLAIKVVKQVRKCGITLVFLTQSPTAASIPKDLTRNCSNGVAFAVADQVAADGLLGSWKYRQGIRATELRPGEDRAPPSQSGSPRIGSSWSTPLTSPSTRTATTSPGSSLALWRCSPNTAGRCPGPSRRRSRTSRARIIWSTFMRPCGENRGFALRACCGASPS